MRSRSSAVSNRRGCDPQAAAWCDPQVREICARLHGGLVPMPAGTDTSVVEVVDPDGLEFMLHDPHMRRPAMPVAVAFVDPVLTAAHRRLPGTPHPASTPPASHTAADSGGRR